VRGEIAVFESMAVAFEREDLDVVTSRSIIAGAGTSSPQIADCGQFGDGAVRCAVDDRDAVADVSQSDSGNPTMESRIITPDSDFMLR
jgi:hypothetical protein